MELGKSQRAYFNAAKVMSQVSSFPRVNVGAVAIYKHKIISSGCNSAKTSPIQKRYNKYRFSCDNTPHCIHAEIDCLKSLVGRNDITTKDIQLYIYREMKDGSHGMARPCQSCMKLIKELGIHDIYYTTYDGFAEEHIDD